MMIIRYRHRKCAPPAGRVRRRRPPRDDHRPYGRGHRRDRRVGRPAVLRRPGHPQPARLRGRGGRPGQPAPGDDLRPPVRARPDRPYGRPGRPGRPGETPGRGGPRRRPRRGARRDRDQRGRHPRGPRRAHHHPPRVRHAHRRPQLRRLRKPPEPPVGPGRPPATTDRGRPGLRGRAAHDRPACRRPGRPAYGRCTNRRPAGRHPTDHRPGGDRPTSRPACRPTGRPACRSACRRPACDRPACRPACRRPAYGRGDLAERGQLDGSLGAACLRGGGGQSCVLYRRRARPHGRVLPGVPAGGPPRRPMC